MTDIPTLDKLFLLRLAFKGLDDNELEQVAALTEFRTYPANHILCHEGAYEDVLYIIAEGTIIISQKTVDGEDERILRPAVERLDVVDDLVAADLVFAIDAKLDAEVEHRALLLFQERTEELAHARHLIEKLDCT